MTDEHSCLVTAPGSPGAWHRDMSLWRWPGAVGTTPCAASTVQSDGTRQGAAGAAPWAWVTTGHVCWWGHADPVDVTAVPFLC